MVTRDMLVLPDSVALGTAQAIAALEAAPKLFARQRMDVG